MVRFALAVLMALTLIGPAAAQETQAAKATRKKLKQKISVDIKEVGTKAFFEEVNLELDKPVKFKIDNANGLSNNTKLSFKAKDITVEKLLNDVSDKFEFGWIVISNKDRNDLDGNVLIRRKEKDKERGYEVGKEPKKGAMLRRTRPWDFEAIRTTISARSPFSREPRASATVALANGSRLNGVDA